MAVSLLPDGHYAADSSADIEKLTDLMHHLLQKIWGPDWGTFSSESPVTGSDSDSVPLPHITYNLTKRVPMKDRTAKWTAFDSFPDPDNPGHNITLYRQWFECEMEFVVHCDTNKESTRLAQKFEEFVNSYVGYFKQQGVSEIIFLAEEAPETLRMARQTIAARSLVYYVRIERISVVKTVHFKTIEQITRVDSPTGWALPEREVIYPDGSTGVVVESNVQKPSEPGFTSVSESTAEVPDDTNVPTPLPPSGETFTPSELPSTEPEKDDCDRCKVAEPPPGDFLALYNQHYSK